MDNMSFNRGLKLLLGYFLKGVLITVPIAIIVLVFAKLFIYFDQLAHYAFPWVEEVPGLGIIILVLFIAVLGYVVTNLFSKALKKYFLSWLDKVPIVKTFYTSISDLLSTFVGKKRKFNVPVLVKLSKESNIEKLGFVTREDLSELGIGPDKVAVYLPHSFNFSGNLFIVDKANISLVEGKPADVMKIIVSGGISEAEKQTTLEDE